MQLTKGNWFLLDGISSHFLYLFTAREDGVSRSGYAEYWATLHWQHLQEIMRTRYLINTHSGLKRNTCTNTLGTVKGSGNY